MTITKDSLVEMVHNEIGLNKREAKELIESFFEQIKKSLEEVMILSYQVLEIST